MMIHRHALYFEDDCRTENFSSIKKEVWIFPDGHVKVIRTFEHNGRQAYSDYDTVQEFFDAMPVVAREIMTWCRENGRNFDAMIRTEGTDIVPIERKCKTCGQVKPVTKFPYKESAFDRCHDECCDCRIKECQRVRGKCVAPVGQGCGSCPASGGS